MNWLLFLSRNREWPETQRLDGTMSTLEIWDTVLKWGNKKGQDNNFSVFFLKLVGIRVFGCVLNWDHLYTTLIYVFNSIHYLLIKYQHQLNMYHDSLDKWKGPRNMSCLS